MGGFSRNVFISYLINGQLHDAVNYLRNYPEMKEKYDKYIDVFEQGHYLKRTDNEVLDKIDRIYQNYYRNIFWLNIPDAQAKESLFNELWQFCGSKDDLPKDELIEEEIEKIVRAEGYEYLGGTTQGYYGPYIWKSSTEVTYKVEIPTGIESYTIIMMDGFISRSWLDFISFGETGTGGWASDNGTLCCIKSLYDLESDEFKISFLKHEAQHAYDKKKFKDLTATTLEYRAKLVELIYWPNEDMIKKIFTEADNSNPDNSHAVSSYRIINRMSQKLFNCDYVNDEKAWEGKVRDVKSYAFELLDESSRILLQSIK